MQGFGLQLHLLALTGHVVGALAVDLAGREGRGHLHDGAAELLEGLLYGLTRDVRRGIGLVDGVLKVVAGGGGT